MRWLDGIIDSMDMSLGELCVHTDQSAWQVGTFIYSTLGSL